VVTNPCPLEGAKYGRMGYQKAKKAEVCYKREKAGQAYGKRENNNPKPVRVSKLTGDDQTDKVRKDKDRLQVKSAGNSDDGKKTQKSGGKKHTWGCQKGSNSRRSDFRKGEKGGRKRRKPKNVAHCFSVNDTL